MPLFASISANHLDINAVIKVNLHRSREISRLWQRLFLRA